MLGPRETARLQQLKERLCPLDLLVAHHGMRLADGRLLGAWRAWAARRRKPVQVQVGERYDRHALESFLQEEELLPVKWAAARLGMTRASFEAVLAILQERGRLPALRDLGEDVVDERLVKNFHTLFPALRSTLFANHTAYCTSVHEAVRDDLGHAVTPLRCRTAEALGEDDFADDFDAITDWPMGLRYQVWLETAKPMNLRPDACTTLLYARAAEELRPLVMSGEAPEYPPTLRALAPDAT